MCYLQAAVYKAEAGMHCNSLVVHIHNLFIHSFIHHKEKIAIIKKAEAHAESLYLSGVGVARERVEIAKGYIDSMNCTDKIEDENNIRDIVLMTQYLEMLTSISKPITGSQNMILHCDVGHLLDLKNQINSS